MKKLMSVLLVVAMLLGCMMCLNSCSETTAALNVGSYPDTIDPALNSAVDGATYIIPAFVGLVGYEQNDKGE